MISRHPCNAVFPVILVSSVVFSILSLPFFLYRSQTDAATTNFYEGFQPVLESKNRDLTIRYIGVAMVLSVITGISTIEVQRNRQVNRTLSVSEYLAELDQPEVVEPFSDSAPLFDAEFAVEMESAEMSTLLATESGLIDDAQNETRLSADSASPQPVPELIGEHQEYSTCRIWVQHLHRRLFAIQIEGQFYSFFRLLPTLESARQTAFQLSADLTQTVITPVEQEFAVWIWQPEAELEAQSYLEQAGVAD
jgi:hypothetical protein